MDIEQTIGDIERLERILEMPDTRPLTSSDVSAANQKHDAKLANSPWFRLWQTYGICCRSTPSEFGLGEVES
ncbi:MAG TPA: hypothetical protein VL156_19355 [Terriglobales bacterium]|jgi:hypothetical protein|nr:hypothetical protein [Terriglobales bacterium]